MISALEVVMMFRIKRKDLPDVIDLINISDVATEGLSADLVSRVSKKTHEKLLEEKKRNALASYITIAGTELIGMVAGRIAYALIKKIIGASGEISRKLDKIIHEPLITGARIAQGALKELNDYSGSQVPRETMDDLLYRLRSAIDKLEAAYTHASTSGNESQMVMIRTIQGLCEAHIPPRRQSAKEHLRHFLEALEIRGNRAYKTYRKYANDYVQPRKRVGSQFSPSYLGNIHNRDLYPHSSPRYDYRSIGKYGNPPDYRISTTSKDFYKKNLYGLNPGGEQFGNFRPGVPPKIDELLKGNTISDKQWLKTRRPAKKTPITSNFLRNIKINPPQKVKIEDVVEGRKTIDFEIDFSDSIKVKNAKEAYHEWQHNLGIAKALRKLCRENGESTSKSLIYCPECKKKLQVPSNMNMIVHCPNCGLKFNKKT